MSKIFFDHLVKMEELEIKISKLEVSSEEKHQIYQYVEETIHYRVVTKILDELPREHHERFLEYLTRFPYSEKILHFLKEEVDDIEEKIEKEIKDIEKLLLAEIK